MAEDEEASLRLEWMVGEDLWVRCDWVDQELCVYCLYAWDIYALPWMVLGVIWLPVDLVYVVMEQS